MVVFCETQESYLIQSEDSTKEPNTLQPLLFTLYHLLNLNSPFKRTAQFVFHHKCLVYQIKCFSIVSSMEYIIAKYLFF